MSEVRVTGSDIRENIWEDFTSHLAENNTQEAEELLDSVTKSYAGEAGWEELIQKMSGEWKLWLVGKSDFNYHENGERTDHEPDRNND